MATGKGLWSRAIHSLNPGLSNLEVMIKEKNARVEVGNLPAVRADQGQMMIQLFQNLIGNALKFGREGNLPNVKIHAEQIGDAYDIYLKDNSIGFDERYLDKIFLPGTEHAEEISLPTHSYVSLCFCFWTALKMIDLY